MADTCAFTRCVCVHKSPLGLGLGHSYCQWHGAVDRSRQGTDPDRPCHHRSTPSGNHGIVSFTKPRLIAMHTL